MSHDSANGDPEARQQRFESLLATDRYKGLKAILDSVATDRGVLCLEVNGANSYAELLPRLGYNVILAKQIHVQDSYSRQGPAGGIKAVLPYHDIPSQSSLPTLVNFDGTVTTTPKAASFFSALLAEFQTQLSAGK